MRALGRDFGAISKQRKLQNISSHGVHKCDGGDRSSIIEGSSTSFDLICISEVHGRGFYGVLKQLFPQPLIMKDIAVSTVERQRLRKQGIKLPELLPLTVVDLITTNHLRYLS